MADLKQLTANLQKSLLKINNEDILNFLSSFSNNRTRNRKLSAINSFLKFCHDQHMDISSVAIPMSRVSKNLPKYMTPEEIISRADSINRNTILGKRDYALIMFLYATGCRITEALACTRDDIHEGWLKIRYAKGEKERMVPIAPIALEAIDQYLKSSNMQNCHLWLNYKGTTLSRISAYKIVKKYLGVSPHTLRHSFASSLIIGGADLRVVQELLGHSSLETTQIYTHIEQSQLLDTLYRHHPLS